MSVNYDLYETPDLAKSGEEQPLHARVVLKGSYTVEEFVEQVTVFQHMPHAQVVGVIEAISKELRHLLLKGFSVELGDIGYFSLSLSVDKKVMDPKDLRSPSVSLKDINFRVNRQFKKDIESEIELQRYHSPFRVKNPLDWRDAYNGWKSSWKTIRASTVRIMLCLWEKRRYRHCRISMLLSKMVS